MKMKKRPKRILIAIISIIFIAVAAFGVYKVFFNKQEVKENKVLNTIKKYNYTLKDNKTAKYKTMFEELEKILSSKKVDEEKYASKISEMFIYDFYSLDDKTAKTDVGGVDFVYSEVLDNFLQNAENTYYKYVESNIYNNRKQTLPVVDEITVESVEKTSYAYGDKTDEEAYEVKVSWTYEGEDFTDYQKEATLVFIHNDIRLDLVELQ